MMITFGVKSTLGYNYKLCINHQTKEMEYGQCLVNNDYVDIWVTNMKNLNKLRDEMLKEGYVLVENEFSDRR